jgi:cephalosporin hydroxylase
VIETGVAHGISSRIVLEALARNDNGHLWSIDLPHPFNHKLHGQTGVAVTDPHRPRWTYLEGESRRRMPPLIAEVGKVELFIHDSLHTAKNTLFEMEQAASVMAAGGVLLVDDIRGHDGFKTFARRHPDFKTVLCSSADRAAGFGIAVCGAT